MKLFSLASNFKLHNLTFILEKGEMEEALDESNALLSQLLMAGQSKISSRSSIINMLDDLLCFCLLSFRVNFFNTNQKATNSSLIVIEIM